MVVLVRGEVRQRVRVFLEQPVLGPVVLLNVLGHADMRAMQGGTGRRPAPPHIQQAVGEGCSRLVKVMPDRTPCGAGWWGGSS